MCSAIVNLRSKCRLFLGRRRAVTLQISAVIAIMALTGFQTTWGFIQYHYQWGSNGTAIAFNNDTYVHTLVKCPQVMPPQYVDAPGGGLLPNSDAYDLWLACQRGMAAEQASQVAHGITGSGSMVARASATVLALLQKAATRVRGSTNDATGAGSVTLSSSTPGLPFLGNRLAVISYAPNSSIAANVTANYSVGLRRQSNCSLNEDFILPDATTPNTPSGEFVTSVPGAQDYIHQLSGLTTTPDIFANGCAYPILGQPSSSTGLLLQPTSNGGSIDASVGNAGIYITIADPIANTFTSKLVFPGASLFSAVDVNGDGNVDIVAESNDPTTQQPATAVFLGNGDGTFKPGVYYDINGDFTVDDVTGDGKPDIVVCAISGTFSTGLTTGITTLIGKGDGTFTVTATSAAGIGCNLGGMLTGDFNGDGKNDLLVHDTVLLGNGDGTFAIGAPLPVNTGLFFDEFGNTVVGDVNNDGKLDVVASQPGVVAVFYGNGDGTFTAGPRYAGLPDLTQVSITDIDGDGNLDIVLATSTAGVFTDGCCGDVTGAPLFQILMGRGDGTFVDSVAYNQGYYNGSQAALESFGPQIATGDFNGDRKSDALVFTASNTSSGGTLSVLPGDGTGRFGTPIPSSINVGPTMIVTASINKDGNADAVVAGGSDVSVLLNQGNGTFAGEQDYTLPSPAVSLVTGDFNGDGLTDIAVGVTPAFGNAGASGVYVLLGKPNGTFATPVQIDTSVDPTGLTAADINADGKTDLVVADAGNFQNGSAVNGALHVYLGTANGTFAAAPAPTTSATGYGVAALGDLNADGKLDLIVTGVVAGASAGSQTVNVYTLLGNGDGTFQAPVTLSPVGQDGGITSLALADYNKDGHLDVAVGNPSDFTEVLLGDGDGTLTDTLLALGQKPGALAAVDLNGDGFPELLVGTTDVTGSGNLAVFLNANAWTATAVLPATTTTLASSAASITTGQSLTLTATIAAASGTTVPTGTVTILDGSTFLGSGTLAGGIATYTTSALAAGTHPLTASYGGSTTFAGSTSSAVTVTVTAGSPDFTAALSPISGTVAPGQSLTTTVTLTPSNGFNQTVVLSCSGLPAGATCSFSSASVAVNGSATTSTLTIATAPATAMSSPRTPLDPLAPGGTLLASLGVPMVVRRRRTAAGWLRSALLALLFVGVGTLLQSCGGGGGAGSSGGSSGGGSSGTPAGTYTVSVTATAGSTTHTATYALTIS